MSRTTDTFIPAEPGTRLYLGEYPNWIYQVVVAWNIYRFPADPSVRGSGLEVRTRPVTVLGAYDEGVVLFPSGHMQNLDGDYWADSYDDYLQEYYDVHPD